jgi:BirA family biotin operon repressor/biotin-[acetyl-CoA-carboxylase] ligase
VSVSDSLAPEAVLPLLRGRFGHDYRYVQSCPSTQRLLGPEDEEGTVVVADEQTEGRGRLGRSWEAPAGTSILCSVLLRPTAPADRWPQITVVAAGACAAAVTRATRLDATIKEPNDVLISRKKVAGVLGEAREGHVVVGIGLNVNVAASELPVRLEIPATSLMEETGARVPRAPQLAQLLACLESRYDAWLESEEP